MNTCLECEQPFTPGHPNGQICNPCKPLRKKRLQDLNYRNNKAAYAASVKRQRAADALEVVPVIEPYVPAAKPTLLTDTEQRAIDRAIDNRYAINFQCVCYHPTDAGFETIAAQITPLSRIRSSLSTNNQITAAQVPLNRSRYAGMDGEI